MGYDDDDYQETAALADLPQAREAYEEVSQSHHYHFSAVEIGEDMGDLVEGFQWITSDEKLLSSCAVFTTVTSTLTRLLSPALPLIFSTTLPLSLPLCLSLISLK